MRFSLIKAAIPFVFFGFFLPSAVAAKAAAKTPAALHYDDLSFRGVHVSQSVPDPITLRPGEQKTIGFVFRNTGQSSWKAHGQNFVSVYTVAPEYHESVLKNGRWLAPDQPAKALSLTRPGKLGVFKITITAPAKAGSYREEFNLAAEKITWIKGAHFDIQVNVVSDKNPAVVSAAATDTTTAETAAAIEASVPAMPRPLIAEPLIRVGLYKSGDPVTFRSPSDYAINSAGESRGTIPADTGAVISYSGAGYTIKTSRLEFTVPDYLRLVPSDPADHFTLTNFNRPLRGRPGNFNSYRGTLEYRFSPKSDRPYVINELPLDEYVAGIGEAADGANGEYAKALLTAARSYAYARLGPVSDRRLFDVYPTTADQLYLGYHSEEISPTIVAAGQATYGQMVTYHGSPVTTPYFGHSAGRTKTSSANPWLKSVAAPYDKGYQKWGHGLGMSSHDAELRAMIDGWTASQILTYYYTGVAVEKVY